MPTLSTSLPRSGRILAVDPGSRRIGLALSDVDRILARPLTTLEARGPRKDAEAVLEVARRHDAVAIVVGLPLNMDGSHGASYEAAEAVIARLQKHGRIPVYGWDERLTSVQAARILIDSGARRSRRRQKGAVDRVAAALILESFLASLPHVDAGPEGGHGPP